MAQEQRPSAKYPNLRADLAVVGADGGDVGRVIEVFRDIGSIETFGKAGIPPQQAGHDPEKYAYSEAMPGAGDDYFTVRDTEGGVLYIPFSAIHRLEDDQVSVGVDADSVALMGWTVRPDALTSIAHEYETDDGAESNVA